MNQYSKRIQSLTEYGIIEETTLSRVYRHFKNPNIATIIISAFRNERTFEENMAKNVQLAALIKAAGYGYIFAEGHWVENQGKEDETDSTEQTIIVPGNEGEGDRLITLGRQWARKFNQEAILAKWPDSDVVYEYHTTGTKKKLGKFVPKILGPAYTKLKGRGERVFTFDKVKKIKEHIEPDEFGIIIESSNDPDSKKSISLIRDFEKEMNNGAIWRAYNKIIREDGKNSPRAKSMLDALNKVSGSLYTILELLK